MSHVSTFFWSVARDRWKNLVSANHQRHRSPHPAYALCSHEAPLQ